jgi:ribonuclease P protein component
MARIESISGSADFRRVMREGASFSRDGVRVYVAGRAPGAGLRLGLVVRSRGAVTRNRVRRRLKEAVAAAIAGGAAGDLDVVVRADERASRKEFQELVKMVSDAVTKAIR